MNWYVAKIVYRIAVDNGKQISQFDEQYKLIEAQSEQQALKKAIQKGLNGAETFTNKNNQQVSWEFLGIGELLPINELKDGVELYLTTKEQDEPTRYIEYVKRKSFSINERLSSLSYLAEAI